MIRYFLLSFYFLFQVAFSESCDLHPFHYTCHLLFSVLVPCSQDVSFFPFYFGEWFKDFLGYMDILFSYTFSRWTVADGRYIGENTNIKINTLCSSGGKIIAHNASLCSQIPFSPSSVAQFSQGHCLPLDAGVRQVFLMTLDDLFGVPMCQPKSPPACGVCLFFKVKFRGQLEG